MHAWGITDGSAGMKAQIDALAHALDIPCEHKTIALKPMFSWQPNALWAFRHRNIIVDYALDKSRSDSLGGTLPDLVISCGRKASLIAMGMRQNMLDRNEHSTQFINIQDPRCPARYFDLVIAMAHDKITGENVLKTLFALHAITPEKLSKAQEYFTARFASFPKPYISVLLGGSTNKYKLSLHAMKELIAQLEGVLSQTHGSLLLTPSLRTGKENIHLLNEYFKNNKRVYIYDGKDENPYIGLLALANTIIATNDSVNMMSEAHATGKPFYILPLPGHKNTKPARFADALIKTDIARPLGNKLENWEYTKSNHMEELATVIKQRLALP